MNAGPALTDPRINQEGVAEPALDGQRSGVRGPLDIKRPPRPPRRALRFARLRPAVDDAFSTVELLSLEGGRCSPPSSLEYAPIVAQSKQGGCRVGSQCACGWGTTQAPPACAVQAQFPFRPVNSAGPSSAPILTPSMVTRQRLTAPVWIHSRTTRIRHSGSKGAVAEGGMILP